MSCWAPVGYAGDSIGAASFPNPARYGVVSARLRYIQVRSCDDTDMSSSPTSDLAVVYDDAVTPADLETWGSELEGLFVRLRPLFYRTESKKHAEQYVRGLLSPLARKNGWTIAEHVGEPEPTPLQRFLNLSPWDGRCVVGPES